MGKLKVALYDVSAINSSRSKREWVAPRALLVEGATPLRGQAQAPVMEVTYG
jgi:hypothetical protein